MTKIENKKCEKLMYEAICKAKCSNEEYKAYENLSRAGIIIEANIKLRQADQHIGYAEGIHQLLAVLGFNHKDMKVLGDLL